VITGTVTYRSGEGVLVRITATQEKTKTRYDTTTDAYGVYILSRLPAGRYSVSIVSSENEFKRETVLVRESKPSCLDVDAPSTTAKFPLL